VIPQNKDLWDREVIVLAREDVKHSPTYKNCITTSSAGPIYIIYHVKHSKWERNEDKEGNADSVIELLGQRESGIDGHVLYQEIMSKIFNEYMDNLNYTFHRHLN